MYKYILYIYVHTYILQKSAEAAAAAPRSFLSHVIVTKQTICVFYG